MDLLGPSLWDIWSMKGQRITERHAACMAVEALSILQKIHAKRYVSADPGQGRSDHRTYIPSDFSQRRSALSG